MDNYFPETYLPSMPRPKSTDERRRLTEQFRRRRVSVFKAATQIYLECGVESFILFRRNGVFYTYKATEDESWPPSREEVVRINSKE
jgi:hypothetical protein